MFDSESITPIPLDPEKLAAFIKTLPREVVEQFVKNWRGKTDALEGDEDEGENRILDALLRRLETER
jgi:hypothetical protein